MRISIVFALLVFLFPGQSVRAEEPLKVLFIGNSYTSFNNLPGLVAALAEAAGGRKIETAKHTPGGCTFQRHFEGKRAVELIGQKKWDFVVLQEQSMMPVVYPKQMHQFARKLHSEIEKRGAKTVFFLTWARQHKPKMQDGLNEAYFGIARELGAAVAPVGPAWKNALAADGKLALHRSDKSHPNAAGSYLAACVFYATLMQRSPVGLPASPTRGSKTLMKLDPNTAAKLQRIAWDTVRKAGR